MRGNLTNPSQVSPPQAPELPIPESDGGATLASRPPGCESDYCWCSFMACAIFSFTASRLKLAPFCIGGYSRAVMASFATSCWTNTKRQNSKMYQSKYV